MKQNCKYNRIRDYAKVQPTGWVDLASANANSSLDAQIGPSEEHFNGINDPNSIGCRPRDNFELMQANKAIAEYVPPKSNEE